MKFTTLLDENTTMEAPKVNQSVRSLSSQRKQLITPKDKKRKEESKSLDDILSLEDELSLGSDSNSSEVYTSHIYISSDSSDSSSIDNNNNNDDIGNLDDFATGDNIDSVDDVDIDEEDDIDDDDDDGDDVHGDSYDPYGNIEDDHEFFNDWVEQEQWNNVDTDVDQNKEDNPNKKVRIDKEKEESVQEAIAVVVTQPIIETKDDAAAAVVVVTDNDNNDNTDKHEEEPTTENKINSNVIDDGDGAQMESGADSDENMPPLPTITPHSSYYRTPSASNVPNTSSQGYKLYEKMLKRYNRYVDIFTKVHDLKDEEYEEEYIRKIKKHDLRMLLTTHSKKRKVARFKSNEIPSLARNMMFSSVYERIERLSREDELVVSHTFNRVGTKYSAKMIAEFSLHCDSVLPVFEEYEDRYDSENKVWRKVAIPMDKLNPLNKENVNYKKAHKERKPINAITKCHFVIDFITEDKINSKNDLNIFINGLISDFLAQYETALSWFGRYMITFELSIRQKCVIDSIREGDAPLQCNRSFDHEDLKVLLRDKAFPLCNLGKHWGYFGMLKGLSEEIPKENRYPWIKRYDNQRDVYLQLNTLLVEMIHEATKCKERFVDCSLDPSVLSWLCVIPFDKRNDFLIKAEQILKKTHTELTQLAMNMIEIKK